MNYQKNKDRWLEERQKEKRILEEQQEQELIDNVKTIKKPKHEVEFIAQRMYGEAEKRQIKFEHKKNRLIKENKINIEDFFENVNQEREKKNERNLTPNVKRPAIQNKIKQSNYNFQVKIYPLIN